eukprot:CAMPEP_0172729306 /NCGR_PEP_ID=MMETSP1074-20121228/94340_1 /TAXON_ID=2916 /ORGANISM="Ceratium fusus, Strain PA161109" /LENGTH=123 /DNA_ID=CAMNT_0013556745 /DNA_START=297 /DNA_END=668 /DNA_ORIENTATION=+
MTTRGSSTGRLASICTASCCTTPGGVIRTVAVAAMAASTVTTTVATGTKATDCVVSRIVVATMAAGTIAACSNVALKRLCGFCMRRGLHIISAPLVSKLVSSTSLYPHLSCKTASPMRENLAV